MYTWLQVSQMLGIDLVRSNDLCGVDNMEGEPTPISPLTTLILLIPYMENKRDFDGDAPQLIKNVSLMHETLGLTLDNM